MNALNDKDSFYIMPGWLIDGTGGKILQDAVLEISGGKVKTIVQSGKEFPKGHNFINFRSLTLLPCLVDCHIHLAISGNHDPEFRKRQLVAPFDELRPMISEHITGLVNHGVLGFRDGGDHNGYALRYKKEHPSIELIPGTFGFAGRAWHAKGRYGRLMGRPPLEGRDLAGAIEKDHGSIDHIKIINSGLNSLSEYGKETPAQFGLEELKEAVLAGKRSGLKTMVHANGKKPVEYAVGAGCDSIEHGFFMGKDNLSRMAEKGTVWVPTMVTMKAYSMISGMDEKTIAIAKKNLDHQVDQIGEAKDIGVTIATGTDSGSPGVRHGESVGDEIELLISAGFSIEEAIRCATLNGARLLGVEDRIGAIRQGMPATFMAVKGGPEMIPGSLKASVAIWVDGRRVENYRG